MKAPFGLVSVLAIVLASLVSLTASPGAVSRLAATCKPQTGYGAKVGRVVKVRGDVLQGAEPVRPTTALRANATLCVTAGRSGGRLTFELERAGQKSTCTMRPGARLRLYPNEPKGAVIQFVAGTTSCGTGKGTRKKRYHVPDGAKLTTRDPLFVVSTTATKSVVKVKLGAVTVSGRGGRGAVVVGPNQQTTVPARGVPQEVVPIRETAADKKDFGDLKSVVPKPDLGRPSANGSPALKRILAGGLIRIGHLQFFDAGTDPFTEQFFAFLAQSWGVKRTAVYEESVALSRLLRKGALDILVTDDLATASGLEVVPLFTDSLDSTWYVVLERDGVFAEALRNFVRATVNGGQYSAFYRDAFDAEPSLDALRPILVG